MIRIAIVGPVAPFRGGIAQHTTAIARALSQRADVDCRVYSFSRLYPAALYPGEAQKDPELRPLTETRVEFSIDACGPWTWGKVARTITEFEPDIVVIPAWTFFIAPCLGWLARYFRKRNISVVMFVHNVVDHDKSRLKAAIVGWQLGQASAFVTHNHNIRDALVDSGFTNNITVELQPVTDDFPDPPDRPSPAFKAELLSFGLVRPYKGLDLTLRALALTRRKLRLRIVGEIWAGAESTMALIRELDLEDRVELIPRYVSEEDAAHYFANCDAVVLSYRWASGSGVAPMAYRYGKPVLVSDLPALTEIVSDGETGWVVSDNEPETWAIALDEATPEASIAMRPAIEKVVRLRSWDVFVEKLIAAGR